MRKALFTAMHDFVTQASRVALREQPKVHVDLKSDESYVTNVDHRLSNLAYTVFSRVVPVEHIITEEHLDPLYRLVDNDSLNDPQFLVVVDPIDGTRNYVHQMPLYGISVGVLQKLRPWLGIVAFPGLNEMFYFDGENGYFMTGFSNKTKLSQSLTGEVPTLNQNSILLASHSFAKSHAWNHNTCQLSIIGCAAINLCWPAIRRGVGSVFQASIWDLAGSWPIFESTGLRAWRLANGSQLDLFELSDFDPKTLKLKQPVLVCHPEHFDTLSQSITLCVKE